MTVFEGKMSSNDIINNSTMSDDEVVASDVPRGTCFSFSKKRKTKRKISSEHKNWGFRVT